jgi:hypothetical protein
MVTKDDFKILIGEVNSINEKLVVIITDNNKGNNLLLSEKDK